MSSKGWVKTDFRAKLIRGVVPEVHLGEHTARPGWLFCSAEDILGAVAFPFSFIVRQPWRLFIMADSRPLYFRQNQFILDWSRQNILGRTLDTYNFGQNPHNNLSWTPGNNLFLAESRTLFISAEPRTLLIIGRTLDT